MTEHARESPSLLRRTVLKLLALAGTRAWIPAATGCGGDGGGASAAAPARFLTDAERETLEAMAGAILPEDETVGAVEAGAVEYVDRWLAAFDHPQPDVYRGGPFSGRTPYPDPVTGDAGRRFPPNRFREVLPLTRLQELAFRIELYGSADVPGGDVNAGVLPAWPGYRNLYRDGVAQLEQFARDRGYARLADMPEDARLDALRSTPKAFRDGFVGHLCEGIFCDPIYGGNRDGIAWRDYHFDGDSHPLGHTLFDPVTGEPRDRPDQPNQTLDPALPNDGLEPDVERFIQLVAIFQDGGRFF